MVHIPKDILLARRINNSGDYGCLTKGICADCLAHILSNSDVQKLVITKMVESLTSAQLGDMLQRLGFSTSDDDMRFYLIAQLTGEFK